MLKLSVPFLVIAVICGIIGFTAMGGPIITGVAKALFGTFLILFFIGRFFGHEPA
jgi:uncharacterized membrane protein YtjA (UPF0391 family)